MGVKKEVVGIEELVGIWGGGWGVEEEVVKSEEELMEIDEEEV